MTTYLVGMLYHEPESWALYQAGVMEDCESSTGIFIDAYSLEEAVAWGEKIAETLLRKSNNDETLDWKGLGYFCWVEAEPNTSNWKHCLSFFQRISLGEWSDFDALGTFAYEKWAEQNGITYT